jgi:pyruvate dehydrogenase E1 component alpha subunit
MPNRDPAASPREPPPAGAPETLDPRVTLPPGDVDEGLLLRLYRQMQVIRRVEEESARAYAQGKIGGFLHLYIGQESVAVGAISTLRPEDYVVTTYRDHGVAIAKATGCSRGLGGSMHLFDPERGMLGGHAIVGGHVPLAVGAAFASRYRDERRVTLCFFGEGAVSIGAFHEGMSLAALWKLPVVFICENNEYAMGTPLERTLSLVDVSQKALAYGMARDRFFARDVLEVRQRVGEAVSHARETSKPTLIEIRTYRFRGHSMSDPGKYRTQGEIDAQRKLDPLVRARDQLRMLGVPEAKLASLDREIEAEIEDAIRFAEQSPEPEPSLLQATTYAGPFAR